MHAVASTWAMRPTTWLKEGIDKPATWLNEGMAQSKLGSMM